MLKKKYSISKKTSYTTLVLIVLFSFMILSCEKEKAKEVDPNTLPLANFFIDDPYQYKRLDDGNTYAHITVHNNSAYSNRWKWKRPGSIERIDTLFRPIEFETLNHDTIIIQVYLATNEEQRFQISLTAYSDVAIGVNPDSTIIYKIFESHPFIQEVRVKKPE